MFPDPNKALQAIDNIKAAFEQAAYVNTGSAQPLFQKLSDKFNEVVTTIMDLGTSGQKPNMNKVMLTLLPHAREFQETMMDIRNEAQVNPAAAQALSDLEQSLRSEVTNLLPPGFKLPGMGFPPSPPSNPRPVPKPKKPNKGDFDL